MTLAEFFVKIGFKIQGKDEMDKVNKGFDALERGAVKAAIAVDVVSAALSGLMYLSMNAGLALNRFALTTGESTEELQQWQFAAAKFGVQGEKVAAVIKNIQQQAAEIRLNGGNINAWGQLGVDPQQNDKFKVLMDIHRKILEYAKDPAMARLLTSRVGISEEMFTFLARPNLQLGELRQQQVVTEKQAAVLAALNGQWEQMKFNIEQVGIKFASALSPEFWKILTLLSWFVDKAANFVNWINSGSDGAHAMREAFQAVVPTLFILSGALTTIAASMKMIGFIAGGLGTAFSATLPAIFAVAAAITALYWAYMRIKDSLHDRDANRQNVELSESGKRGLKLQQKYKVVGGEANPGFWDMLGAGSLGSLFGSGGGEKKPEAPADPNRLFGQSHFWANLFSDRSMFGYTMHQLGRHMAAVTLGGQPILGHTGHMWGATVRDVTMHNNVTIPINGAKDPASTGSAVKAAMKDVHAELVNQAYRQMPVQAH